MIVSGESKPGQTQSRTRSRRRGGESDASRLTAAVVSSHRDHRDHHQHHHQHEPTVGGIIRGMTSTPIVVEEEDDDVVVSSPTAFAQAKSIANADSRRSTRSRVAVAVEEDPLELRLGLGGTSHYSIRSVSQSTTTQQPPLLVRRGRQFRPTIDLTTPSRPAPPNEDCVLLTDTPKSRKRKNVPIEPCVMKELPPVSPVQQEEETGLKCAICMDTMQEETSTICGHLFCQSCIQGAIKSQKKCPTCRKKLTMKNIHRIYI